MFCKNCGQQLKTGIKFCQNCGQEVTITKNIYYRTRVSQWFKSNKKTILITSGILIFFIIIGSIDSETSTNTSVDTNNTTQVASRIYNQEDVTSSVVNILCPSAVSEDESSGGSGTILTEDGIILTNSHIIPQDDKNIHVDDDGCLVVLPDPVTGKPKDIYLAHPIVINEISEKYDLAYMEIYAAYYDEEKGEYAGTYPRKFPAFDDSNRCTNDHLKLGEPVRIFGYPAISGGYSLTITDGVVSSFPEDGLVITSAKISHGNSGGLAVDSRGCMIGVPSMVSSDESESLGVIISMDYITKFSNEVQEYSDKLDAQN